MPTRYQVTARAKFNLSPWSEPQYSYSILQLENGNNPLSRLQVVSKLNILSQARYTYHYNSYNCPERYYPKVYIGTIQTIAKGWIYDLQKGINHPSTWPEIKPQKGEANTKIFNIFYKCFLHLSLFSNTKDKFTFQSLIAINIGL